MYGDWLLCICLVAFASIAISVIIIVIISIIIIVIIIIMVAIAPQLVELMTDDVIVLMVMAGSALVKCGQMQQKLAEAERQFVQSSITIFLFPLKSFLDGDMKIIQVSYGTWKGAFETCVRLIGLMCGITGRLKQILNAEKF